MFAIITYMEYYKHRIEQLKKQSVCTILYPEQFASLYVYAVEPAFTDTLSVILEKSGRKDHIKEKLSQRLKYLEEKKHKALLRSAWFENLKNYTKICFIKIKDSDLNIRISVKFINFESKQYVILISAFTETKGGKSKTDSYSSHIKSITPILEQIENDFKGMI
jgi:hypothetical protein